MISEREGSSIGPYEFTVRFHEDGFVVRMLEGDAGVLLTVDRHERHRVRRGVHRDHGHPHGLNASASLFTDPFVLRT